MYNCHNVTVFDDLKDYTKRLSIDYLNLFKVPDEVQRRAHALNRYVYRSDFTTALNLDLDFWISEAVLES